MKLTFTVPFTDVFLHVFNFVFLQESTPYLTCAYKLDSVYIDMFLIYE